VNSATENAPSLLASLGEVRPYANKTLIIREGSRGNALFILLSGRIRIFTEDADGRRFVIGSYGSGTFFGEGALDGGPRTASVEAVGECTCAVISYAVLQRQIVESPAFSLGLITELIKRSRASTQKMKSLALESVYQRLRQLFEEEGAALEGERKVVGPAMSQQEIANRLGASRDMVTRILRELTKGGYVKVGRGQIELLKPLPKAW
jgi:CRP/FNR family cyclic AMP-dependent transcriptional regulator